MIELSNIPVRLAMRARDHRGYPVPWFVQWMHDGKPCAPGEGEPDFRIMDRHKWRQSVKFGNCWICGERVGTHKAFTIGPMCAINRTTAEPPSHYDCALFSVRVCPFLSRPRMRRNTKDLPIERAVPGEMIERNPGAVCIWMTKSFSVFQTETGPLIRIGPPTRVEWFAEGTAASRAQVLASIDSGYPLLEAAASKDGPASIAELVVMRDQAMNLIPGA